MPSMGNVFCIHESQRGCMVLAAHTRAKNTDMKVQEERDTRVVH